MHEGGRDDLRRRIDGSSFWDVDITIRKAISQELLTKYKAIRALEEGRNPPPQEQPSTEEVAAEYKDSFRTLWGQSMELYHKVGKKYTDAEALTLAFFKSVDAYTRKPNDPNDSFCSYLGTVLGRYQLEADREDNEKISQVGRETARKIKKAKEYIDNCGYTISMLLKDPALEKAVAVYAHIGVKTLHEELQKVIEISSLDQSEGEENGRPLSAYIPAGDKSTEELFEEKEERLNKGAFPKLHSFILLMDLQTKGRYFNEMGPFWSGAMLRYLRLHEKAGQQELRLDRCEDIRPLEEEGLLWDQLLLRSYVQYTIQEPLYSGEGPANPKELESAALNPLVDPNRKPHLDKTVAAFLARDKSTLSTRRRKWDAGLQILLR